MGMKGLLVKDWYMTLRYGKFMLVITVIYAFVSAFSSMALSFGLINVMLGSMLVKTLMAYEEQNRWDCMAVCLPVTAKCIVAEKYVMGLISIAFTAVLTSGVMFAASCLSGRGEGLPFGSNLLFLTAAGILWLSLELPVLFRFGVNKGRIWFVVLVALAAGILGGGGAGISGMDPAQKEMAAGLVAGMGPLAAAVMFVISAGLMLISSRLSVRFYRKREF